MFVLELLNDSSIHSVAEVWGSYFSEGTASTISPHTTSFYISFAFVSVDQVCSMCFYNYHATIGFLSIHIHKRESPEISKFYKSHFEGCGPPRKANKGSKDRSFYVDCP